MRARPVVSLEADAFRLDADGKVVEHWDVLQVIAQQSAHGNGPF